VELGDFGRLFAVHGSYLQDWLQYETDWNWRLETEKSGDSRALADIGSHWLDLVTYVCGEKVVEVCADLGTVHPHRKRPNGEVETFSAPGTQAGLTTSVPISTEDFASVLMRLENGAQGVVTVSQVSAGRKNRLVFEIDGATGSAAWNSEQPNELWLGHRDRPNEQLIKDPGLMLDGSRWSADYPGGHTEGFPDTFKQLYKRVYAAIENGMPTEPDFPTFEDGHYELELLEAMMKSHASRSWVKVKNEQ
jgi:predicted dehydrogenase